MNVRFADQQDLETVLEIERLSFSNPWNCEFLENVSKDIFLVYGEQEVYGFLIAGCCHRNVNATILKIAVHPEHRRKGIAINMIYKLVEILEERQIAEVDVIVKEVWEPAMSLYKKAGFKIKSTIPQPSDDGNFFLMQRHLTHV